MCLINVLRAIAWHGVNVSYPLQHTFETGCGKSTLLLSHLSAEHVVFTISAANDSLPKVLESPLLKSTTVQVIDGPSQATLPTYQFKAKFQLALLDGSHGYPVPDLEYFYVYPHMDIGALLIVDDIQIPSIFNLFEFIAADEMFSLIEVVGTTAFFRRTSSPTIDPLKISWTSQRYNQGALPKSLVVQPESI